MRIVKMSLVAAVAVAGLSTASLADEMMKKDMMHDGMMMGGLKISGVADFRWKSTTMADEKKTLLDKGTVEVNLAAASKDGKGNVHANFASAKGDGELKLGKAYADYKLGMVTLVVGSKMAFPGNFSDSTVQGVAVKTKVAGFDIATGLSNKNTGTKTGGEKSIVSVKGKVAIAELRFDYKLGGDKTDYLATDVTVKVGPATIIGGYAAGMGDNNKDMSLMGADVSVGLGMVTAYGAFSLSGDKGGKVTEKADKNNALGGITGANGIKTTAMKFGAKAKVAGIDLSGYYSMATPDGGDAATKIYVDAKKSLNAQSTVSTHYTIATPAEGDATNTLEVRFISKF